MKLTINAGPMVWFDHLDYPQADIDQSAPDPPHFALFAFVSAP